MKLPSLLLTLALASCTQTVPASWAARPNPLDEITVPAAEPSANGHWGPFGTAPASHRGNFNGSP